MKTTLGLLRIERKSEGLLSMNRSLTSIPMSAWAFSETRESVRSTMMEVGGCQAWVGERSDYASGRRLSGTLYLPCGHPMNLERKTPPLGSGKRDIGAPQKRSTGSFARGRVLESQSAKRHAVPRRLYALFRLAGKDPRLVSVL